MQFIKLFVIILVPMFFAPAAFSQSVERGTCSFEKAKCDQFCKTDFQNSRSCFNACERRLGPCLITGTYYWKSGPNSTGLKKCCGNRSAGTCSAFANYCTKFCKDERLNSVSCRMDCRSRTSASMRSGEFKGWPEATGLIRQ
jgi:hypothetical protein